MKARLHSDIIMAIIYGIIILLALILIPYRFYNTFVGSKNKCEQAGGKWEMIGIATDNMGVRACVRDGKIIVIYK